MIEWETRDRGMGRARRTARTGTILVLLLLITNGGV